ncbi:TIGR04282 family arsenosugar biosynthesis glycosyltransferase [Flagellimonas nanhaiensis]|uniref:TIGR04282 family arsenosugar biosynthesis glycosyltransferase n=1 Tax=Flagellimonas nanhaiensis TaxID=2292706 RepID=UPI003AAE9896
MTSNLLLILTRNPELGKCKTRLAAKVGDAAALSIYEFLLDRTVSFTKDLDVSKWVFYSESIWENDVWDSKIYAKKLQIGSDLGQKMANAFEEGFNSGFKKIVIIGSDMYDLSQEELEEAFSKLENHDFVVGPAEDGGYYLLGMTSLKKELFQNKSWGTDTVLSNTLKDLNQEDLYMLEEKNDVDHYEDIKDIPAFKPFLKHMKE